MLCEWRPRGLSFGNCFLHELFPRSLTMPANLRPHSSRCFGQSEQAVLYVSLELGGDSGTRACASAPGPAPRLRKLPARDVTRLLREIAEAKRHLRLPA